MKFKKIIWEEFHDQVRKKDRGLKFKRSKNKNTKYKNDDLQSDEDLIHSEIMEELCKDTERSEEPS